MEERSKSRIKTLSNLPWVTMFLMVSGPTLDNLLRTYLMFSSILSFWTNLISKSPFLDFTKYMSFPNSSGVIYSFMDFISSGYGLAPLTSKAGGLGSLGGGVFEGLSRPARGRVSSVGFLLFLALFSVLILGGIWWLVIRRE